MTAYYAGADWLETNIKYMKPGVTISPLGRQVADLLGELFLGLYHLDSKTISRVDWSDTFCVEVSIGWKDWATYDFDNLTRLVFLSHHMAIRVSMDASKHGWMKLMFWQRSRDGSLCKRHPSLDEAVRKFKESVSIPEYFDNNEVNIKR